MSRARADGRVRGSLSWGPTSISWDPERRLFDYQASPPGPSREDKERISRFLDECAGANGGFGLLVERLPGLRGERISGFSMSELIRLRGRVHVAILSPARNEEIMVPVVARLTGVPMQCFRDRAAALRWLGEKVRGTPPTLRS